MAFSSLILATLYPPPKFRVWTVGKADEIEAHGGHLFPHFRVGTGSDVSMDSLYRKFVIRQSDFAFSRSSFHIPKLLAVPGVGTVRSTRAEPGLESEADEFTFSPLSELMDLVKGTKVRLNTVLYPIPELIRIFLSAQGDGLGSNAADHRPLDLKPELASMPKPSLLSIRMMAAVGAAFIA